MWDSIEDAMQNVSWFTWLLIILIVATMSFLIGGGVATNIMPNYDQGYRAAWEDHNANRIDCVVSVKHPEWLKTEGK